MSVPRPKNTITISARKNSNTSFNLWSSNDFFTENKEVVFEHDEYGISFRTTSIDDTKNVRPVYLNNYKGKNKSYSLCVYNETIKTGVFYLDEEESDCDKVVFNY
tara:strand:+ start:236 stop:550 length:315 start_codon:yes stop_codon:yes gene_type:complete